MSESEDEIEAFRAKMPIQETSRERSLYIHPPKKTDSDSEDDKSAEVDPPVPVKIKKEPQPEKSKSNPSEKSSLDKEKQRTLSRTARDDVEQAKKRAARDEAEQAEKRAARDKVEKAKKRAAQDAVEETEKNLKMAQEKHDQALKKLKKVSSSPVPTKGFDATVGRLGHSPTTHSVSGGLNKMLASIPKQSSSSASSSTLTSPANFVQTSSSKHRSQGGLAYNKRP